MATRRIKHNTNAKYVQPLKLKTGRKIVLGLCNNYTSVLFTKKHKAFDENEIKAKVWAKFNGETFDGIHIVGSLNNKEDRPLKGAQCEFKIYYVDANANWGQTLLHTANGTYNNNKWVLSVSQATLGVLNVLDGERSLLIEATITRVNKTYKSSVYINHLGIFDSFFRLKQEVEWLDLTKKDE